MLAYLVRRIVYMIPVLIIVSMFSFVLIQSMPGDYLTRAQMNPQIDQSTIDQMRHRYGLDKPLIVRYWNWLKGAVHGDFGISLETKQSVFFTLFMGNRLQWTLVVSISTMIVTWLMAIPLGIYSATHQYKPSDHTLTFFGFLGLSIPNFFLALLLLWVLVVQFDVGAHGLGVGGLFDNEFIGTAWTLRKFCNLLWHLWPAWLVMGTAGMASLLRYMRGSLLDTLSLQYVQTARAKGAHERVVIYKHAVRNAINPLITIFGMSLRGLVAGSLVTAVVLNLPTVERAYWSALKRQDEYVIMGGLIFFSVFLLLGNLFADFMLAWSDPRIRYD